ncbi:hypothetical protein EZV62_024817 [Acer yangbiense]|uniref:CCHC-type domain-containing protein n=1 Tax=Acer yangbiense TaxID=1000413 RepID=A0A5C7GX90_9ROSI|nr:hypothetical protein EZV62_024817 [Acer yangbiense]
MVRARGASSEASGCAQGGQGKKDGSLSSRKDFVPGANQLGGFSFVDCKDLEDSGGVEIEVVSNNIYASTSSPLMIEGGCLWVDLGVLMISNIPMICMTKDIGQFLGSFIGEVREVDVGPSGDCLETILPIQYERLPNFCFRCGLVGHSVRECTSSGEDGLREGSGMLYGAWLRATVPFVQYGRGNWGGHVNRRNQGVYRRDNNLVQQAREFNQQFLVKSGNTRLPEGSSGKDASGGINQVGDGSGILVGSGDVISNSVPSSNLNFVASRDSRPAG